MEIVYKRSIKSIIAFFLSTLIILQALNQNIYAQQTDFNNDSGSADAITLVCLKQTKLDNDSVDHVVKLQGTGLRANTPYELWRQTENEFQCAVDINNELTCPKGAPQSGNDFKILDSTKKQLVTDANGTLTLNRVRSHTPIAQNHTFFAVQPIAETASQEGDNEALKLATFAPNVGKLNECTSVFWDPKGIVFDSVSLEPVPGAKVTLLDNQKQALAPKPGLINPFPVRENGQFNFFVKDGTYFLSVQKSGYRFPITANEITKLQSVIQSKNNIYTNLYTNAPIIQKNRKVERRDIPIMPLKTSQALKRPPAILEKQIHRIPNTNGPSIQMITGTVSHPYSEISVYSGLDLIASTTSNVFGQFSLKIDSSLFDQDRPLELIAKKSSLFDSSTKLSAAMKLKEFMTMASVLAKENNQSAPVQIYPIPEYIEGYVYNNNAPVANAVVQIIVPQMNNKVLITAVADKDGFIKIPQSIIPPVEFSLRISDKKNTTLTTMTPATFIEANKEYIQKNKINLFNRATSNDKMSNSPIIPNNKQPKAQIPFKPSSKQTIANKQALQNKKEKNISGRLNALTVTLAIIIVVGGAIFFLIKNKKIFIKTQDTNNEDKPLN